MDATNVYFLKQIMRGAKEVGALHNLLRHCSTSAGTKSWLPRCHRLRASPLRTC
jgi:hypothetical protein